MMADGDGLPRSTGRVIRGGSAGEAEHGQPSPVDDAVRAAECRKALRNRGGGHIRRRRCGTVDREMGAARVGVRISRRVGGDRQVAAVVDSVVAAGGDAECIDGAERVGAR